LRETPAPQQHPDPIPATAAASPAVEVRTFEDVLTICSANRDARLRVHLEEHVSLVTFAPGHIEIFPLPGAPKGLAGELGRKLSDWTGNRWVVSVGRDAVHPTIGEVIRARRAARIEKAKQDPALISLLKAFPEAEVVDVRENVPASDGASEEGK
jgi:DNA polymerase-3 subunit gamma/tau